MMHIYCANSQKVTFCDFCLTFDPLKSLCQHGPNLFSSEMQAAVLSKLNEVKTPWVLVGASNSATQ